KKSHLSRIQWAEELGQVTASMHSPPPGHRAAWSPRAGPVSSPVEPCLPPPSSSSRASSMPMLQRSLYADPHPGGRTMFDRSVHGPARASRRLVGLVATAAILGLASEPASAQAPSAGRDSYEAERALCISGLTHQEREDCLREAAA